MGEEVSFTDEVVTVGGTGEEINREKVTNRGYRQYLSGNVHLDMIAIPGGQCLVGAAKGEEGWHPSQGPQHPVPVSPFFLGRYPVTQAQWREIARLEPVSLSLDPYPACFEGKDRPVERVTWFEAVEFCDRLSRFTGSNYRLPAETEWEYACRAGTTTPFHFGETLDTDLANYSGVDWEYGGKVCSRGSYGGGKPGLDRRQTTPVGMFGVANAFGLQDLHGNVREWCLDVWRANYRPGTMEDEGARVSRGGSWNVAPHSCRAAYRSRAIASARLYDIGFRVARDLSP